MSMLRINRVVCLACGRAYGVDPQAMDRQLHCRGCGAELQTSVTPQRRTRMDSRSSPRAEPACQSAPQSTAEPPPLPPQWVGAEHPARRARSRVPFVVLVVAAMSCLGASFAVTWKARTWLPDLSGEGGPIVTSIEQEDVVEKAVGLVVCAITLISNSGERRVIIESTGTSFAVTSDGYLLTNRHVVASTHDRMTVQLPTLKDDHGVEYQQKPGVWVFFGASEPFPATVVCLSEKLDLAILKIDRSAGPHFRMAAHEHIPRGTKVYALGFPGVANDELSDNDALHKKLEEYVGQKELTVPDRDRIYTQTHGEVSRIVSEASGSAWLQHSAPVSWGNSGGPLVTVDGTVVGINTRLTAVRDIEVQDATQIANALLRLGLATEAQLNALGLRNSSIPILGPGTFFSLIPAQARTAIEQHTGPLAWNQ